MIKKFICTLLTFVMIFSVCACGKDEEDVYVPEMVIIDDEADIEIEEDETAEASVSLSCSENADESWSISIQAFGASDSETDICLSLWKFQENMTGTSWADHLTDPCTNVSLSGLTDDDLAYFLEDEEIDISQNSLILLGTDSNDEYFDVELEYNKTFNSNGKTSAVYWTFSLPAGSYIEAEITAVSEKSQEVILVASLVDDPETVQSYARMNFEVTRKETLEQKTVQKTITMRETETETEHTHDWQTVYQTVHHNAIAEEGHYDYPSDAYEGGSKVVNSMISASGIYLYGKTDISVTGSLGKYYKTVDSVSYDVCRDCGYAVPLNSDGDAWAQKLGYNSAEEGFIGEHVSSCGGSWTVCNIPVVEEVEATYVVDTPAQEAYDEEVYDHQVCSICGATKD